MLGLAPFSWGRRAGDEGLSGSEGHARGSRLPHEGDFFRSEAVGLVDEVGESAFEREGFGGLGAGRFDGCGWAILIYYLARGFTLTPSPSPGGRGEQDSYCFWLPSPRGRRAGDEGAEAK